MSRGKHKRIDNDKIIADNMTRVKGKKRKKSRKKEMRKDDEEQ